MIEFLKVNRVEIPETFIHDISFIRGFKVNLHFTNYQNYEKAMQIIEQLN